ncbi:hypothetical protein [Xylanimonas sp. McL0601]|uniref:hypothetical protein n=1 Tax=Xylanimonas sp. McL0601 TaxID=3414739 RepID=UPI003CF7272F
MGSPSGGYEANVDDGRNDVNVSASGDSWESTPTGRHEKSPDLPPTKYLRADDLFCAVADLDSLVPLQEYSQGACADGSVNLAGTLTCPPDTYQLAPLWIQRLQPNGTYGAPELVSGVQCITPADLAAEAERVFTTMHVPTPSASLQTASTTLLVNAWYPVYTTSDPVTQVATLLDVPVEVRAVPSEFTWDFDDPFSDTGSTLTTADPGRPWSPGEDDVDDSWVAHAWTRLGDPDSDAGRRAGTRESDAGIRYRTDVTVSLTTAWHGQFRIAGALTWTDIPGQITTSSTAGTFTVSEARSRLYCDTIGGPSTC